MTPRKKVGRLLSTTVAAALGLGLACGGDSQPGEPDAGNEPATTRAVAELSSIDACALLTAAEIESATGTVPSPALDTSRAVGEGRLPMCQWSAADGTRDALVGVLVTHGNYADYDTFAADYAEQFGEPPDREEWRPVEGVGDLGIWVPIDETSGMLQAYRAPRMVQISVEMAPGADPVEAARRLARSALGRLR